MVDAGRRALAAVWSIRGVGSKALRRLRARAPVSAWFDLPFDELLSTLALSPEVDQALRAEGSLEVVSAKLFEGLARCRQRVCFRGDDAYPSLLATVSDAPPVLFFQGPGALAEPRGLVAIVGARKVTKEWAEFAFGLANDCASQGLVVVSGAAEGIDTAAHRGTLAARGVTWAFVASGLDQLDHAPGVVVRALLEQGGTAFSESPPGCRSDKGLFVRRNRLVSGSAQAVVVVRGEASSGTRHTAEAATAQGRRVLAVPAEPNDPGAAVCRALLRAGARPCFDVSDVLAAVGLVPMAAQVPRTPAARGEVSDGARTVFAALPTGLFDLERAQVAVPNCPSGDVASALMELELAGWLVTRTGRRYEKRE